MRTVRLTKTRDYVTTVELRAGETYLSDATWTTSDGFVVHRTTRWLTTTAERRPVPERKQNQTRYWVKRKSGYYTYWDTLREAREEIAWLRARGL